MYKINIFLSNTFVVAQRIETYHGLSRGRLTKAEFETILEQHPGSKKFETDSFFLHTAYLLSDSSVVVDLDSHAYRFENIDILNKWYSAIRSDVQEDSMYRPLIKDLLLYGESFPTYEQDLIDSLQNKFKFDLSGQNWKAVLSRLDNVLNAGYSIIDFSPQLFSSLVALWGKILCDNIPNSKWVMRRSLSDSSCFDPYIIFQNKRINPAVRLYHEIYEEFFETGIINLREAFEAEFGRYLGNVSD